jgi:hypothetical protein
MDHGEPAREFQQTGVIAPERAKNARIVGGMRTMCRPPRLARGRLAVCAVLALLLAGCGASGPGVARSASTPPGAGRGISPQVLQQLRQGRVVIPPCLPVIAVPTPPATGPAIVGPTGYGSVVMRGDARSLVGFQPLLPTQLPANVTWNAMFVRTAMPSGIPRMPGDVTPLFHAGYRLVMPQLVQLHPAPPSVMFLDETTAAFAAPANLYSNVTGIHLIDQTSAQVGGAAATLYHLAPPVAPAQAAPAVRLAVLQWRRGPVTLRLVAIEGPGYQLPLTFAPSGSPQAPAIDTLASWTDASDAVLLSIASSVAPYAGCGNGA